MYNKEWFLRKNQATSHQERCELTGFGFFDPPPWGMSTCCPFSIFKVERHWRRTLLGGGVRGECVGLFKQKHGTVHTEYIYTPKQWWNLESAKKPSFWFLLVC